MDLLGYQREAWNAEVARKNEWTVPVSLGDVERARSGRLELKLTPTRFIPLPWLGDLSGKRVLCLASGGGQQGPVERR